MSNMYQVVTGEDFLGISWPVKERKSFLAKFLQHVILTPQLQDIKGNEYVK